MFDNKVKQRYTKLYIIVKTWKVACCVDIIKKKNYLHPYIGDGEQIHTLFNFVDKISFRRRNLNWTFNSNKWT